MTMKSEIRNVWTNAGLINAIYKSGGVIDDMDVREGEIRFTYVKDGLLVTLKGVFVKDVFNSKSIEVFNLNEDPQNNFTPEMIIMRLNEALISYL